MEIEYVAEWYKYADMDLSTADYLLNMHPKPLEIICFHCQQSAEKYLKAFLVYKNEIEPPKTHDLVLLKIECSKLDNRFDNISRACEVLTRYGIQPRYPNEMEIEENNMIKALEYAKQIRDFDPLAELRIKIDKSFNNM